MAMNVGQESETGEEAPMSDINTTPLVDVMLVLLIIFLITIPIVVQTVPMKLPKVEFEATQTKPENVSLNVIATPEGVCKVHWGLQEVNSEELLKRAVKKLEDEIKKLGGPDNMTEENMPEAHIRADINTPYKCVGGAIFTMQRAGFARVGFISEPPPRSATRL
jgi:biopolymer transport protein ExbD